jgi:hypothetical protein
VTDDIDLRAVADRQEIYQVLMRYCRGIDRGEVELLRSVYHPGAIDRHGADAFEDARTQFAEVAVATVDTWQNPCQHHITNHLIELEGDVAHVESYFLAYQPVPDADGNEVTGIVGGRYLDRFERRDGRWAIAERSVAVDWSRATLPGGPQPGTEPYLHPGRREADASHAMFTGLRARLAREDATTAA